MIRLLYHLLLDLVGVVLLPLRLLARARAAPRGAWLRVDVDGPVVDVARALPFWDRRPRPLSLQALRRAIQLAGEDPRVAGVLVVIKRLHAGSATATSLRDALSLVSRAGKRLVVVLPDGGGTREMYVGSVADKLVLGPETVLSMLGFAVEAEYLKDALDRVGVEPEVFARGRYKTAGEMLVSRSMSDAQREQLDAVLDAAWDALIDALSSGRGVERAVAEQWVHGGPWSASAAMAQGIADAVVYDDDVAAMLDPARKDGAPIVGIGRYVARRKLRWRPLRRKPYIAVVDVHGPIASAQPFGFLPMALEGAVRASLKRVLDDPKARGAIVHIDSRGGGALASDRMLHELLRLSAKKPVVAYMGDAAASGGYMVAVGAHAIVAQPTTLTGSIGVVAARVVVGPVLEKLGIHTEVVKRGARADMLSPMRHLDDGERAAMDQQLDEVYRSFIDAVARGRKRTPDEIAPLAGGRVWSGRDAARHGLVDRLGGFDVALEELRARLGAGAARLEPRAVSATRLSPPLALLPRLLGGSAELAGPVPELVSLALATRSERAWLWCPAREV